MAAYTAEERNLLLKLARSAIASELGTDHQISGLDLGRYPSFKEKRGCFVTLHKSGALRGCIGTLEPMDTLLVNVKDNAVKAAFGDPRFPALTIKELSQIDIEISVLTIPEPLVFTDPEDLLQKLQPGIHGVILSQGWRAATFLPQVWAQLPRKESFLSNLCLKAGLQGNAWRDKNTKIKVYEVEFFSEAASHSG